MIIRAIVQIRAIVFGRAAIGDGYVHTIGSDAIVRRTRVVVIAFRRRLATIDLWAVETNSIDARIGGPSNAVVAFRVGQTTAGGSG